MPLANGKTIYQGHYTILDTVASGGFATVYRAQEQGRPQEVAIKLCHVANDPNYTKSMLKEAEILQRLQDPRLVRIHPIPRDGKASVYYAQALEVSGHPPFFVMEYLSGGTLNDYLNQVGPLSVPEAVAIALQVARGLDHMHQKNYAHNDLKLENVVFRVPVQAGQPFQPVLVDFGIAARLQTPDAGSLYIMPPEQVNKINMATAPEMQPPVDMIKVDVWGLGVVLYRMLGGKLPFASRSAKSLTQMIVHSRPTSLLTLQQNVPAEIDALVIDGCLAKDPRHRLTLLDVGHQLAQWGDGVMASKSAQAQKKPRWGLG